MSPSALPAAGSLTETLSAASASMAPITPSVPSYMPEHSCKWADSHSLRGITCQCDSSACTGQVAHGMQVAPRTVKQRRFTYLPGGWRRSAIPSALSLLKYRCPGTSQICCRLRPHCDVIMYERIQLPNRKHTATGEYPLPETPVMLPRQLLEPTGLSVQQLS